MNKKEILEKAKKENLIISDEAKNYKGRKGNTWGLSAAITVWIIFTTIYFLNDKDTYHLFSIYSAYIGFNHLGKYFANKEKSDLIIAIGGILVFIGSSILGLNEIWNF